MAFPTIVGTPAESATTTAGTSHVVNLPSGASGNLFLLIMGKGTTSATINALTGWTELVDENQASGAFCAWRRCDGTEGATTTFTSSANIKSATIVYEITGDDSGQAPGISAVASASTNAPNPNTVTPTGGSKDYLWITWFVMGAASEEADDDTWVNNAATNYGNLLQKTAGTAGTNIGAAVAASNREANASSEDAAWPSGSTDLTITWRSFTIAVHPTPVRRSQVSWAEFQVPVAPRRAQISWAEFQVPLAPRRAQVSWAELETPNGPRRAQISWSELEVPLAPRRAQVSWSEFEVPLAPRRAQVAWSELETPNAPRRAQVAWVEVEFPDVPALRMAQISWAEFEAPSLPARCQISWAELEVPDVEPPPPPPPGIAGFRSFGSENSVWFDDN